MGVALITPFKTDESIDFDALARIVEHQIKNGTDYLVVCGTTAETPTLTEKEKDEVTRFVINCVAGIPCARLRRCGWRVAPVRAPGWS